MNPHRYVRSRLHRRLFVWFGATIVFSCIAAALVMVALHGSGDSSWPREYERVEKLVGGRFARVWNNPAERDELASAIARDLDAGLRVEDAAGAELGSFGVECTRREMQAKVTGDDGRFLGTLSFCFDRSHHGPLKVILPLFVVVFVLWGASGKIARRLARPLAEVARVAHEIGTGKLKSRAVLACRTPDEVGVLANAINDMADRIERQLSDQRVLLAGVSHELRTPLGHLRILLELIRSNGADAKTIDELEREVMEIDTLVGELLASSRLDFTAITPKRLDGADVAKRAVERAGVSKEVLAAPVEGAPFEGDPTLIARALANLIDNAKRHGGGVVAVRVVARDGVVAFEVDDSGAGMPEGDVFEPFYKGNGATRSENGTLGLGLSLVKRIAEAHGGSAYAGRRPEGGARVGFQVARASSSS